MILFHLNLQVGTVNPSEPYTLNYPGMLFYGYQKPGIDPCIHGQLSAEPTSKQTTGLKDRQDSPQNPGNQKSLISLGNWSHLIQFQN